MLPLSTHLFFHWTIPLKQLSNHCCENTKKRTMAIVCLNENILVLELSEVTCDLDLSLEGSEIIQGDRYVDNVMIYIAGFIMRLLIKKEKCM